VRLPRPVRIALAAIRWFARRRVRIALTAMRCTCCAQERSHAAGRAATAYVRTTPITRCRIRRLPARPG